MTETTVEAAMTKAHDFMDEWVRTNIFSETPTMYDFESIVEQCLFDAEAAGLTEADLNKAEYGNFRERIERAINVMNKP